MLPTPPLPLLPPPELEPAPEPGFVEPAFPEQLATMSAQMAVPHAHVTSTCRECLFTVPLPLVPTRMI